ncbi:MAG: hypothetical protein K9K76_07445 [Halanaerobiales bacterium]|nr:hypothetical protein [Halanaerobiales bacterium]
MTVSTKIDVGIIALEPTEKDIEAIKHILDNNFNMKTPNIVYHVYKNRRSQYKGIRLWSHVDLGTCRADDLFVTDANYKLIPMKSTIMKTIKRQAQKEMDIKKDKKYSSQF